ncbi:MAG: DNA mismatch repair endonuclease MutL [Lachnospiraceae bacterium]|nr:DNA mismatch repair endonuclease MutL [Lachnospiraceae bacterium]
MNMIQVLDQLTIDKIAAGEVVERPSSVVKELVENAIDSGATAITIEIKDGGISFIRITDNGCGIPSNEVQTAFLRHATSKIKKIEDLLTASSLGFRGEALSSIAAVSQVELITKTSDSLTGVRYEIHGGKEITKEEIGCPEGTTFIIRNLFYNTPARRKFLKTSATEGGYVNELVEQIAMSRPDISFKFVNGGQNKLNTSGNGNVKDIIYQIYGRDISANLLPIDVQRDDMKLTGFIGKPYISRGNRSFEHYFVNGRYIKSPIITRAIEEAYKTFVMVHKFPFTVLNLTVDSKLLDVNVHPRKMEMRYSRGDELYKFIFEEIRFVLLQKELIPDVGKDNAKQEQKQRQQELQRKPAPEPFEINRKAQIQAKLAKSTAIDTNVATPIQEYKPKIENPKAESPKIETPIIEPKQVKEPVAFVPKQKTDDNNIMSTNVLTDTPSVAEDVQKEETPKGEQMTFVSAGFMTEEARPKHRLIGQLFKTYWLIEYEKKLFIMDQHAAHEKVMYEKLMKQYENREIVSQQIAPPLVISVNPRQVEVLREHQTFFEDMGFQMESFSGKEYMLRGVPLETYGLMAQDIFIDFIDSLMEEGNRLNMDMFIYKIATMACKAAVKGNMELSYAEADALIDALLALENPYNCPHGRPTIISMTETEIEKKFKRIQN